MCFLILSGIALVIVCWVVYTALCSRNVKTLQEDSIQTEEVYQEPSKSVPSHPNEVTVDSSVASRETLFQDVESPCVKKSLHQVFDLAYSQFLSWSEVSEPMDCQPLYKALWQEVDLAAERVTRVAYGLDIAAVSIGCIRILSRHLHDVKEAGRGALFSSRENEVAFLRVCSEALVQKFLPESIWSLDLNHCALKEIVAFKVLQQLVTWLSDPDTLNQLLVRQLDAESLSSSAEELRKPGKDHTPPARQMCEEDGGMIDTTGDAENRDSRAKRKRIKLKNKIVSMLAKVIPKKDKKKRMKNMEVEDEIMFLALEEDSCLSSSEREVGDLSSDQGFNLLYEMWQAGHWTITVPEVEEQNEGLVFTVHLADQDISDDLQWDVTKSEGEVQLLLTELHDLTHLPPLSDVLERSNWIMDDRFKEEARAALERFLQVLVSERDLGHSEAVFRFLCTSADFSDEVWELLTSFAIFLTSNHEDEESIHTGQTEGENLKPQAPEWPAVCGGANMETGQEGGSPAPCYDPTGNPPADSTGPCNDEGVQKTSVCSEKVSIMDLAESKSNISNLKFGHRISDSASSLDQLAIEGMSKPTEPGGDHPTEHPANRGTDQPTEQPSEPGTDLPTEHPASQGTDQPTDQSAEPGTDLYIDQLANQGADQPAEQHAKWNTDQPANQPADGSTDQHTDQRTDKSPDQDLGLPVDPPAVVPKMPLCSSYLNEGSRIIQKSKPFGDMPARIQLKQVKGQGHEQQEKAAPQHRDVDQIIKALIDLLKEIFSKSLAMKLFEAVLKLFKPLILKKVTGLLDKLKLTDSLLASAIDSLQGALWPKGVPAVWGPPRSSKEKSETMKRACDLLTARSSKVFVLKKSNVESAFKVFQHGEENKKLVYNLLLFLLMELLPNDRDLCAKTEELLKSPLIGKAPKTD